MTKFLYERKNTEKFQNKGLKKAKFWRKEKANIKLYSSGNSLHSVYEILHEIRESHNLK